MGETRVVKIEPTENPGFFAIIPAIVRYADITPNAKLLFGELTALTNREGYCWANNSYFSKLYGVSERTISRWIEELFENKFINVIIEKKYLRKIYLSTGILPIDKNFIPDRQKFHTPMTKMSKGIDKKFIHNNTYNKTIINKENKVLYAPSEDPNRISMIEAKGILKGILAHGAA